MFVFNKGTPTGQQVRNVTRNFECDKNGCRTDTLRNALRQRPDPERLLLRCTLYK